MSRLVCLLLLFFLLSVGCTIRNEVNALSIEQTSFAAVDDPESPPNITLDEIDWVNFDPDVATNWDISAGGDIPSGWPGVVEGNTIYLSPLGRPVEHEIVAIFSKPSSAYTTALNTILSFLDSKARATGLTVIQMHKDPTFLPEIIEAAETKESALILSFGSQATEWMVDAYTGGSIPVITVTSKDPVLLGQMPDYETGSQSNFAFTSLNIPIDIQLSYLQQFRPNLQQIGILYAENNSSAVETQVLPLEAAAKAAGIEVVLIGVKDQSNAKVELADLMPLNVTQMLATDPTAENSLLWITGSTSVFNEIETINRYANGIPVMSAVTDVTTAGENSALMSIGIGFESNAQLAARYVDSILNGTEPGSLPVGIVSPPDIAINFLIARENGFTIPFRFFESATFVYNGDGAAVRSLNQ